MENYMNNYYTRKEKQSLKLHFLLYGTLAVILSIVVISCGGAGTDPIFANPVILKFSFGPFETTHYQGDYEFTMEAEIDKQAKSISFDKIIPNVDSIPVRIEIPRGARLTVDGQPHDGPVVSISHFNTTLTEINVVGTEDREEYTLSTTLTKLESPSDDIQNIKDRDGDDVGAVAVFTEANFKYVRDHLEKKFVLIQDITLAEGFEPIAPDTDPTSIKHNGESFAGIFDGASKTISNLKIIKPGESYIGFFGKIAKEGIVRNLRLILASGDVNGPSIEGNRYVGALAGGSEGYISHVGVEGGYVKGSNTVGGLVGAFLSPLLTSFDNKNRITSSYATGTVSGDDFYVGGLVGYMSSGTLDNSYATGSVSGDSGVGGLVGRLSAFGDYTGRISNTYATGAMSGNANAGGLVGELAIFNGAIPADENVIGDIEVKNSYFDAVLTRANGQTPAYPGVGSIEGSSIVAPTITFHTRDTAQGQKVFTMASGGRKIEQRDFSDWDFTGNSADGNEDIWYFPGAGMWPKLAWQQ